MGKFEIFGDVDNEALITSHLLRTHCSKIIKVVEQFVKDACEPNGHLKTDLIDLGKKHFLYGTRDKFFYVSRHAIFKGTQNKNYSNLFLVDNGQSVSQFDKAYIDKRTE
jgi:hypothetical protein